MTHTPGPWFAGWKYQELGDATGHPGSVTGPRSVLPCDHDEDRRFAIIPIIANYKTQTGKIVCSVHTFNPHSIAVIDDEMQADARLIAAAPALLEALEWIASVTTNVSRGYTKEEINERANAAIAQAKGEKE